MFNVFRRYKDNPGPQGEEPPTLDGDDPIMEAHSSLWRFIFHLDKRLAVTDERVRMNTWALGVVIALHLATLGYILGS